MKHLAAGRKKAPVIAVAVCLAVALFATPAYAFWYVHGDAQDADQGNPGVEEVLVSLEEKGGAEPTYVEQIFVPNGSTADAALDQAIHMSNSQNGTKAIHNYSYKTYRDYLKGKKYTISVYHAESQKPGTQTTHDGKSAGDANSTLQRFDNVVITVAK